MIKRNILLAVVLFAIGAVIFYLEDLKAPLPELDTGSATIEIGKSVDGMGVEEKAKAYERAKEIVAPAGFLNTPNNEPITISELIGKKVILLDIWTYSCINCQRTFPYLRAWYDKYSDEGLEIIGIHSPEFEFEKEIENVRKATERFGIKWPVVLDNDFGTWRAYKNRYWPHKYLIDIDGFVVYDHIGEGGYASTEMKIQELLQERAIKLGEDPDSVSSGISEPQDVVTRSTTGRISPEIYFGALRNDRYLKNGIVGRLGSQHFEAPVFTSDNELYLDGDWDVQEEFAKNESDDAKIIFRYQAKDVFMVLSADEPVRVKVLNDGELPGDVAGADVDEDGYMTVHEERLYKIIANKDNSEAHNLELIIEKPGLNAFTFTFG